MGAPKGGAVLHAGDVVLVYGRRPVLDAIDIRQRGPSGEREHERMTAEFRSEIEADDQDEPELPS